MPESAEKMGRRRVSVARPSAVVGAHARAQRSRGRRLVLGERRGPGDGRPGPKRRGRLGAGGRSYRAAIWLISDAVFAVVSIST